MLAAQLLREVCGEADAADAADAADLVLDPTALPLSARVIDRLRNDVLPRLDACGPQEMLQLRRGLEGRFVPPGPSGSPSRGRPDVLPTGRNFYSVDTRAGTDPGGVVARPQIRPASARTSCAGAWRLPARDRHLGVGTATMRTGGDDIAQALALLGVRPKWAPGSHRVTDFEIMPVDALDRPRIDVTLRVSGFFRDAFANVMHLFDAAVQAVAGLDEPEHLNPLRARVLRERDASIAAGMEAGEARRRAGWRVFGAKPGSYGAGLQDMIDTQQWQTDADLANAYRAWGGYAYAQESAGEDARDAFGARLATLDVVLQNQDNREHDLLDSNDYYQFQGGMAAAVRHFAGVQPHLYHADHSNPAAPRIRTLHEEIARVIRSRVVNPKWLDGVKRHGYKGRGGNRGDRGLPVRLRRHRARGGGPPIRARHRRLSERRRHPRVPRAAQSARAARDLRTIARSDAARLVAVAWRLSRTGRAASAGERAAS